MKMREKLSLVIFILWLGVFTCSFADDPNEGHVPLLAGMGPGVINLPLDASPFTGEAYTSVPIKLLPAAGDIQNKLPIQLQYRSGGGNSWAGKGWELELGYIAKINKFGANNPNNPYLLVLQGQGGELVSIGGNQYRTKIESNMRIEFDGSTWKVWQKDGTQYAFENSAGGKWVLTKITNAHGISAAIDYYKPNNEEIYLSEINYPQGPGVNPYCKISFISENRADPVLSYYYGACSRINSRLKEIQIKADGYLQKKYVLDYTTNGVTHISFLSAVTESGKNGQALPPVTFSYQNPAQGSFFDAPLQQSADTGIFYSNEAGYVFDYAGFIPGGINVALIDVNGDGLPDLVGCKFVEKTTSVNSKSQWVVRLNTGNGFSAREDVWVTLDNTVVNDEVGTKRDQAITLIRYSSLIDMNKDGLPDLVYSKFGGKVKVAASEYNAYSTFVRYNEGNKFSDTETKLLDYTQAYFTYQGLGTSTLAGNIKLGESATLADINGDGLPDLIYYRSRKMETWGETSQSGGGSLVVYPTTDLGVRLNTGNGFSSEEKIWLTSDKIVFKYTYIPKQSCVSIPATDSTLKVEYTNFINNSTFVDMNGDGLVDFVFNDYSGVVSQKISSSLSCISYSKPCYNWKVRYNTGDKFSDDAVTLLSSAPVFYYGNDRVTLKSSSVRIGENGKLVDINNDDLPDLVYNQYETGTFNSQRGFYEVNTPWIVRFNLGNSFGAPVQMFNSLDYDLTLDNKATKFNTNVLGYNSYFVDIDKDGVPDLVYPQFTTWDSVNGKEQFRLMSCKNRGPFAADLLTGQTSAFGGSTGIDYLPSNNFNNNGADSKNKLPFVMPVAKSVSKNPGIGSTGTTSYNYEGGWYDLFNREFRGFRHVQAADPLGYISNTYFLQDDARLGKVERQDNPVKKIIYTYKDDSVAPYFTPLKQVDEYTDSQSSRTAYDYDDYGNVVQAVYSGDTSVSGDEKTISTDYALNPAIWLVDLPSRERIFDANNVLAAETQYIYDYNSLFTDVPSKGDLTKTRMFRNTKNDYLDSAYTFDSYGNELTKTDPLHYVTTTEYDPIYHAFPAKVTNAEGHIEKTDYYGASESRGLMGQLKSKTDANNNEAAFEYDGLGRKTKVIGPYDVSSAYGSESYEYGVAGPGSNYILTRTTEESNTANHLIKVDIFDGFERVVQSSRESENEGTGSYTTTDYNGRGELSGVTMPYFKPGPQNSYLSPDGIPFWTQYSYDALGRVTTINKPDGSTISNSYSGWTTTVTDENNHPKTFVRDAYGRLAGVAEQNGGNSYSTTYKYDVLDDLVFITDTLGNKFQYLYNSLRQKTKMVDPDLGTWQYDYDDNENLFQSIDGNGKTIRYGYDKINRLTSKDYLSQSGLEITYIYDENTSANGIGRRTSMKDLSGASRWGYDKEGRIVKLEKTIDGNTYKIEWDYDAMSRIKSIIYPNLETVNFAYNNAGLLESIDGYSTSTDYNANQQPTAISFVNSLITRYGYYDENARLKSISTGPLQDLRYEYYSVGNIKKITDMIRGNAKDYTYDDLDRLLSGDGNSYQYSPIGNIVLKNNIAQAYYDSQVHALKNDGANSYNYDSCGNMVSGAGRGITYDPENRPVSISKNGIVTSFFYDGDGKRVKKTVNDGKGTSTTIYIEDLFEKEINN